MVLRSFNSLAALSMLALGLAPALGAERVPFGAIQLGTGLHIRRG
jgi:hypothetical protein